MAKKCLTGNYAVSEIFDKIEPTLRQYFEFCDGSMSLISLSFDWQAGIVKMDVSQYP